MAYLTTSDVPGVRNASELIAELEAYLSIHHPCLADLPPEKRTILTDLLKPVIRRWGHIGTGVATSEAAGPFRRDLSNGGGHVLWAHEIASLRALCGQPATVPGLPLVSAPPPEPIGDLFARRPGWPRPDEGL